jgi:hypothetical protein
MEHSQMTKWGACQKDLRGADSMPVPAKLQLPALSSLFRAINIQLKAG